MKIQSPSIATKLVVSGSFDLTSTSKTSLVNQITGSLNTLYTQSGSVSQASWDTLQNKPSGIVSSSSQVLYTGLTNVPIGIISSSGQISSSIASSQETFYFSYPVYFKRSLYYSFIKNSVNRLEGIVNIDVLSGTVSETGAGILMFTEIPQNNWTINMRGREGGMGGPLPFSSYLNVGSVYNLRIIVNTGITSYYQTGFQIDGVPQTPLWEGTAAPTAGFSGSANIYDIQIYRSLSSNYIVVESLKQLNSMI